MFARKYGLAHIPAALKDETYWIKLRSEVARTNILYSLRCILVCHSGIHTAMQIVLLLPSEIYLAIPCARARF